MHLGFQECCVSFPLISLSGFHDAVIKSGFCVHLGFQECCVSFPLISLSGFHLTSCCPVDAYDGVKYTSRCTMRVSFD
uniref:Uncharacterized protein n=1 Tax=Picea sitchensis TaxID=3332 RepID=D5AE88_PICSI|nr:unknown [Picea sitchensis]